LFLSEQQILDCAASEFLVPGLPVNEGCKGGSVETALNYLAQFNPLFSQKAYPFLGVQGTCKKSTNGSSRTTWRR
jgi:hypothetical protein